MERLNAGIRERLSPTGNDGQKDRPGENLSDESRPEE